MTLLLGWALGESVKLRSFGRALRQSGARELRLLRAHGVIRKVPKTHRSQLTERGRLLTAALRATRDASIQQLLRDAA